MNEPKKINYNLPDSFLNHPNVSIIGHLINNRVELGDTKQDHYVLSRKAYHSPITGIFEVRDIFLDVNVTAHHTVHFQMRTHSGELIYKTKGNPQVSKEIRYLENCAFLEDKHCTFNVCHFMFDKLARVLLFQHFGLFSENAILFQNNHFTEHYLSGFGIKSVIDRPFTTLYIRKLYFSSNSGDFIGHPGLFAHDLLIDGLSSYRPQLMDRPRHSVMSSVPESSSLNFQNSSSGQKKYLILRPSGSGREILNEGEVIEALIPKGFEVLYPESLSPKDQRSVFNDCDAVVAVHGAALTNILFMPTASKVVEILPPLCATHAYYVAASRLGLSYRAVVAEDEEELTIKEIVDWKHEPAKYNRRNIRVPIDELLEAIAS